MATKQIKSENKPFCQTELLDCLSLLLRSNYNRKGVNILALSYPLPRSGYYTILFVLAKTYSYSVSVWLTAFSLSTTTFYGIPKHDYVVSDLLYWKSMRSGHKVIRNCNNYLRFRFDVIQSISIQLWSGNDRTRRVNLNFGLWIRKVSMMPVVNITVLSVMKYLNKDWNFEKNPYEILRSCFVSVAWNFFSP